MSLILQPWHLLLVILAGWINRQQQEVIEYLRTENQVLKEKLGPGRILLNDDQRRRLAVKGKVLGRKRLEEVGALFTPETILRWHRTLVAKKWDYSARRPKVGRPLIDAEIVALIVKLAQESPTWGYDRIQGALANLGHHVSDQTVGNVLKDHGIEPAPERKRLMTWSTFLKAHWDVLAAVDFKTVEGLDQGWLGDLLLALRHGVEDATRMLCGLHAAANLPVDDAGGSESDRLLGRIPERQEVLAHGSRRQVLGGVPVDPRGFWRGTVTTATAIARFEFIHRAIYAEHL